jgi:hypothetical protein
MAEKPERRIAQIVSFIFSTAVVIAFSYAAWSAIFGSHQKNLNAAPNFANLPSKLITRTNNP